MIKDTLIVLLVATTAFASPTRLDLRETDQVTPVRDQGGCGSCWAFSAVAAVESAILYQHGLTTTQLPLDLSEQALITDLWGGGSCSGGNVGPALHYVQGYELGGRQRGGGLPLESAVPCTTDDDSPEYVALVGGDLCQPDFSYIVSTETWGIRDYITLQDATLQNWKDMLSVHGAIATSFYFPANFRDGVVLEHYEGQTVWGPNSQDPIDGDVPFATHGMAVVGYQDDVDDLMPNSEGYFILKNSWGPNSGDGGFRYTLYEDQVRYIGYAVVDPLFPYQAGDLDRDGFVTFLERATAVANVGLTIPSEYDYYPPFYGIYYEYSRWSAGDADFDGVVSVEDARAAVLGHLPEPSSIAIGSAGVVLLGGRRRRRESASPRCGRGTSDDDSTRSS